MFDKWGNELKTKENIKYKLNEIIESYNNYKTLVNLNNWQNKANIKNTIKNYENTIREFKKALKEV